MNIVIHCQPSLLETIQEKGYNYEEHVQEIDVILPYTKEVEDVNNKYVDEADFCTHYGINYNQVNCIELI